MHLRAVLVPVYVIAYVYGGLLFRYVVNGQTGRAHGTAPWSGPKLALLVLALVLAGLALARAAG
jgi:hypothetical protein